MHEKFKALRGFVFITRLTYLLKIIQYRQCLEYWLIMELTTYSKQISESQALVEWSFSKAKCGKFLCTLLPGSESIELIAEMVVIRHLIDERQIFGQKLLTGKGLTLNVSSGAIKKLVLGKSDKKDASHYANYLSLVLDGCKFKVHKNQNIVDCESPLDESLDILPEVYGSSHYLVNAGKIGEVFVTRHAIERYQERTIEESGECKYPLATLIKRLSNKEIEKVQLPEKVLNHKLKKYRNPDEDYEVWKHPTSSLHFGIVLDKKTLKKTLVTIFIRS
ncbi:hypothetical protein [Hydrogenovibrio marinus]|nr:hypothetical protein [Hydrogenovibrio marinus]